MEENHTEKLPCIRKTRILFQKLSLDSSKSQIIYEKENNFNENLAEKDEKRGTSLDFNKTKEIKIGKMRRIVSTSKIKSFKIPSTENFKYNTKLVIKKNFSSPDGFVIHKFSIPNGLLGAKKKSITEKISIDYSQILNPNLKPSKKGPSGLKIYSSTKSLKKSTIQNRSLTNLQKV